IEIRRYVTWFQRLVDPLRIQFLSKSAVNLGRKYRLLASALLLASGAAPLQRAHQARSRPPLALPRRWSFGIVAAKERGLRRRCCGFRRCASRLSILSERLIFIIRCRSNGRRAG